MSLIMRYIVAVALTVMSLGGLPALAQSPVEAIAAELGGLGIEAGTIELLPGEVRVIYEHPMAAGEEDMIVACLRIMDTVEREISGVERVVVWVDYIGEPLLEFVSNAADIRALADSSLSPEVFAERLIFNERRSQEQALRDNMATLGIWSADFRREGPVLHVSFAMPDGPSPDTLPEIALQILSWIAANTSGLERVVLHTAWPDGTETGVGSSMADVLAWRSGALPEAGLTARLDWTDPPLAGVPVSEPDVSAQPLLDPLDAGP